MLSQLPTGKPALDSKPGVSWRFCLLIALLASVPWLVLLVSGISPITLASEAIGYRFFHPWRIQSGEPGLPFLPQGQTLGLFHHAIVFLFRSGSAANVTQLRAWLDGFAFATNFALTLTLFASVRLVRANRTAFIMVSSIVLFAIYACRSGVFSVIDPDYYGFELAATALVTGLGARWLLAPPKNFHSMIILLGVLAGLMAGIKFTLAPTCLLALAPVLFAPAFSAGRTVKGLAIFGLVAAVTFLVVLTMYYGGQLSRLAGHFHLLSQFIKQGISEDRFWPSLFAPGSAAANPGADYSYARLVLLVWAVSMAAGLKAWWRVRTIPLAAMLLVSATLCCLHGWGLFTRPAGTTLWEACLCLLASAANVGVALPLGHSRQVICLGSAALLAIVAGGASGRTFTESLPVAALRDASAAVWRAHDEFLISPAPRVFLIPDNNYTAGTVEETLMKGLSDHPTWEITTGREALRHFAGDMRVLHNPETVPPEASVLMVELQERPVAAWMKGRTATHYPIRVFPWWSRTISLYRPATAGTLSATP